MKRIKKLFTLCLCLLLVVVLSGCQNEPTEATKEQLENIITEFESGLDAKDEGSINDVIAPVAVKMYSSDIEEYPFYLSIAYRESQTFYQTAVDHWKEAIILCENYSNTQVMKEYLTELVDLYSPLLDYNVTEETLEEYKTLSEECSEASDAVEDNITAEIDSWTQSIAN